MASTETTRDGFFTRLYTGTGALDIVGKRKRWYAAILVVAVICLGSMAIRGFNLGIDFQGGTKIQMPTVGASGPIDSKRVEEVFHTALNKEVAASQTVGSGATASIQVRSEALSTNEVAKLKQALFDQFKPLGRDGQPNMQAISDSLVSESWGGEITKKALIALVVFLVLVSLFLAFYFERWMAVAGLIALGHDLLITAGVYSLVGFEVTPATVIGLLTILGFSLYDTVVVFDKVKENTRGILGLTRRTYAEAANLAVNQTFMRSINTTLIAVLPVLGLLAIGVGLLGVGTLKDLALVQVTGMIAGAFSSIFLATPLLVDFKLRDRAYQQQAARVAARRAKAAGREAGQAEGNGSGADGADDEESLAAELRHERALAAAASVPARTSRAADTRRTRRPAGKSTRPTGKRGR
ncbi:protein translocase subunit SecF [Streptoalloteichus hindustanus]|uniref:Protein-export membrane protein SecF n=1 Tax=Streptoalloteichus hindustanus TaxID=2017 RepID=A0A1M5HB78_STRHI|nr:protein translocase subunit SecF [Streptoalloteichus hindustanus]SHG13204.1 preprotein translocase subunit SecF [Streptoalloteichus hindustanus]